MLSKRYKITDPDQQGDTIFGALLTGTGQKINTHPVQKIGRDSRNKFLFYCYTFIGVKINDIRTVA
jgi:hypothetical protein